MFHGSIIPFNGGKAIGNVSDFKSQYEIYLVARDICYNIMTELDNSQLPDVIFPKNLYISMTFNSFLYEYITIQILE